jgi:CHAD domain-containing protein
MGYRLDLGLGVPAALRAAAVEQLQDAIALLRDEHGQDPTAAIHGARKDLKKTRSLLRLARPALGKKEYRRQSHHLRDVARSISAARDADVMVETVDALSERYAGQLPKESFTALRERLARDAGRRQSDGDAVAGALAELEQAAARIAELPVEDADADALRRGAVRAYARGREALAQAREEPSVAHMHDWRKRVKDLWYHQRLLADCWPGVLEAQAEEAHRLSDLLGDDHDLAVLIDTLDASSGPASDVPVDEDPVVELARRRREELQRQALALGRLVYAEKPRAYDRRLRHYLAAAPDRIAAPA